MMPCRPAMMFWSIVGHAMRQTTGPMGPSMIERSYFQGLGATSGTGSPVYYAVFRLSDYRRPRDRSSSVRFPMEIDFTSGAASRRVRLQPDQGAGTRSETSDSREAACPAEAGLHVLALGYDTE